MECYIELWSARASWINLSHKKRADYMAQIGPHLQSLLEQGVEIVSWGENEKDTSHRANYDFFAVWKFPNTDMKREFEALVMEAGWYNHFHQENASGKISTPEEIIGKLIEL